VLHVTAPDHKTLVSLAAIFMTNLSAMTVRQLPIMATLSSRMSRTMETVLPKLSALKSSDTTLPDVVDLATADNSLCRDEVQDVVNRVRVEGVSMDSLEIY
jgi:hypothetical protein